MFFIVMSIMADTASSDLLALLEKIRESCRRVPA
jgi:hypothetical protein